MTEDNQNKDVQLPIGAFGFYQKELVLNAQFDVFELLDFLAKKTKTTIDDKALTGARLLKSFINVKEETVSVNDYLKIKYEVKQGLLSLELYLNLEKLKGTLHA